MRQERLAWITRLGTLLLTVSLVGCTASSPTANTTSSPPAASATPTTGRPSSSAKDIAVQPSGVPGLVSCPQSGTPDSFIAGFQATGSTDEASLISRSWSDVKSAGARDAYIVGYASSADGCSSYVFGVGTGGSPPNGLVFVLDVVVTFGDSSGAQAAWNAGEFFVPPSQFESHGGSVGNATGLGDSSATVLRTSDGIWFGMWAKGSNFAFLATNYGPLMAAKLAQSVNARM